MSSSLASSAGLVDGNEHPPMQQGGLILMGGKRRGSRRSGSKRKRSGSKRKRSGSKRRTYKGGEYAFQFRGGAGSRRLKKRTGKARRHRTKSYTA